MKIKAGEKRVGLLGYNIGELRGVVWRTEDKHTYPMMQVSPAELVRMRADNKLDFVGMPRYFFFLWGTARALEFFPTTDQPGELLIRFTPPELEI